MLYIFDGTKEGFLTAFLAAFQDENALLSSCILQLPIGEQPLFIDTDTQRAAKAEARLLQIDKGCIKDLFLLLRSGKEDREQTAFLYLRQIAKAGKPQRKNFACPAVFAAVEILKQIGLEIHRFHGFIRFIETQSGALYAPFSPDNDICDLLVPHFKARLPHYPFVLHDVKRKKAAVYDGEHVFVAPLAQAEVLLAGDELQWQALFRRYYSAVNIPSRERLRQMRGYMPARYWQFLTEKTTPDGV